MNSVERRLALEDAVGQRRRWVFEPGGGGAEEATIQ